MKLLCVVVNILVNLNFVLSVISLVDNRLCESNCKETSKLKLPELTLEDLKVSNNITIAKVSSTTETTEILFIPKSLAPSTLQAPECALDEGVVIVPVYVLYILGILLFVMSLIIVYLVVLIYRNKFRVYTFLDTTTAQNTAQKVDINRAYMSQESQEMTVLNMSPSEEQTNQEPNSLKTCGNTLMTNVEVNAKGDNYYKLTPSLNDIKNYKSIRKPADQQLILREQMKKICEDALAKAQNSGPSASLKDLNKLLNYSDQSKPNENSRDSVNEKAASYPQLDIYDEPPPKNTPVEGTVQPIYDSLHTSKNIIIEDYDTNYLLAISKDNLTEPDYINAQYRYK